MPMNEHWPRWIFASVSKHFNERRGRIPLFIEGQERKTAKEIDYFELRVDGPFGREISRRLWQLTIEVNMLVGSKMDELDAHKIHRDVGIAAAAFTHNISIFKLGTGEDDDQTLLGCLELKEGAREALVISHFGQIDTQLRLLMATVEGHYVATIKEI